MLLTWLTAPVAGAELSLADKIGILVEAYPDVLEGGSGTHITLRGLAAPLAVDDGIERDHFAKLEAGDVEDSLQQVYPAGPCEARPAVNFDPGRIRSEALMRLIYGNSSREVAANLVPVRWFGETLRVTRVNGVNKALESVRDELERRPELRKFLAPSAGIFNWRTCRSTVSARP